MAKRSASASPAPATQTWTCRAAAVMAFVAATFTCGSGLAGNRAYALGQQASGELHLSGHGRLQAMEPRHSHGPQLQSPQRRPLAAGLGPLTGERPEGATNNVFRN